MPSFTLRKSVLTVSFLLILYYFIMELYYYYFVGISYLRYQMVIDINIAKYIETKILFILILGLSIVVSKKSDFIYAIFIFFTIFFFVPGLVTYSFEDQVAGPLYATVVLMLAIGTISSQRIHVPDFQALSLSRGVTMLLIAILLIPVLYSFGFYFNINNLVFDDIDQTRQQFGEGSSTLIAYLYTWLVRVIIPVLLIYFLISKRYAYALVNLFILFYLYVISGEKTVYITVFVALFFFFVGRDYIEKAKYLLYWLVAGLAVSPLVDSYIFHSHKLKGTFVMRMLFLPSHLNYFYFDLFKNKPLHFAESNFFKWFFDYPYNRPVGYIISEIYFNAPDMNSNNGIISDGYMNLGYLGVALNILIVSAVFLFFNSIRIDAKYLGIFFLLVFLFLSSPILSMFITSGLWILIPLSLTIMKRRPQLT
jgi:hypothetical protein